MARLTAHQPTIQVVFAGRDHEALSDLQQARGGARGAQAEPVQQAGGRARHRTGGATPS